MRVAYGGVARVGVARVKVAWSGVSRVGVARAMVARDISNGIVSTSLPSVNRLIHVSIYSSIVVVIVVIVVIVAGVSVKPLTSDLVDFRCHLIPVPKVKLCDYVISPVVVLRVTKLSTYLMRGACRGRVIMGCGYGGVYGEWGYGVCMGSGVMVVLVIGMGNGVMVVVVMGVGIWW